MRVWWPSVVLAIVFFGTDGIGVSTAEAGYISCGDSSTVSHASGLSSISGAEAPAPKSDSLRGGFTNGESPTPANGGSSSAVPVSVNFVACLFDGKVELTSQSARSQLLIDRSDGPPGNPALEGILRPPCV